MDHTTSPPSLRTELLANLTILAAAALLVAVSSVLLAFGDRGSPHAAYYLVALIVADISVFVGFGTYQVRRLVTKPIERALGAIEAIAAGDLAVRVPAGNTRELTALSDGVNRMTDRLLAEQTIRVRTEKLASVGRLAAGIAHEIGNPLGAINGYAHILRRRCGDDQGVADAVGGLERESGRIDRIVRGLLDYARPRHATPARIDLNAAVGASMHLLGEQGALRQVDLQLALDPCVPCVVGDAHELEQVFVNLVLNALDAMDHRGRLSITTHRVLGPALHEGARRASDALEAPIPARDPSRLQRWLARVGPDASTVKVIVADSGPGIPEADVERVFDPFYTTKAPGQGTGLGLAIVARTVENLQGTVWVQPAREGGAAFHLLFPLAGSTPLPDERSRR